MPLQRPIAAYLAGAAAGLALALAALPVAHAAADDPTITSSPADEDRAATPGASGKTAEPAHPGMMEGTTHPGFDLSKMDRNEDDKVSKDEFGAYFGELDRDDDGFLDAEEMREAVLAGESSPVSTSD
jgi:hypothetical protein